MMKNILCGLMILGCVTTNGMKGQTSPTQRDSISYHSIVSKNLNREHLEWPVCQNSSQLQQIITRGTVSFISASLNQQKELAEELINDYEEVFCTDKENLFILKELEQGVENFPNKKTLSSGYLMDIADSIAYLCNGLPTAATKIQNMYEVVEKYYLSLLWAIVSYKFGLLKSEETIGRLLVVMGEQS